MLRTRQVLQYQRCLVSSTLLPKFRKQPGLACRRPLRNCAFNRSARPRRWPSKRHTRWLLRCPARPSLFYVEILKGVKDELRDHDIDLLLCNLGSTAPYQTLLRFLERGAVDALLVASLPVDEQLERELSKIHAPVLLVGSRHRLFDSIYFDDVAGAKLATAHLIQQGHEQIGMITAHSWSYTTELRIQGYRLALAEAGIPFRPDLLAAGDTRKHAGFSEEAGAEAIHKLLALPSPPTGVFVSSDVQAFGAWAAIRDANMHVPRDIALIAYDNLKLSRFLDLSTIDQHMYSVGRRAAERLLERINHRTEERIDELKSPELVVRRSSSRPRIRR